LVALDQWVSAGTEPPDNRVPRRGNGTLVPALPQASVGFPAIPGVTYNGRTTTGDQFDFGDQFGQGILTTLPPAITTSAYPVFGPATDADGNDVGGIRLPEIAVPVATYSGWNIRSADFAADDMCNAAARRSRSRRQLPSGSPIATRGHRSRSATAATPGTSPG
jgi:hypothetical protein